MNKPGYVEGRHFTQYVDEVKRLKKEKRLDEAERLLLSLVAAVEGQAVSEGRGMPAGWYHFELAKLYHKKGDFNAEVEIIERFLSWPLPPGMQPNVDATMLRQLERARQARGDPSHVMEAAAEAATVVSQAFAAWRDAHAQSGLPHDASAQRGDEDEASSPPQGHVG